ncbi:MAG TPA: PQQ-binding-like beta-propeller repeat protein [Dongiaceae bacterium]|nr:PQQ-binding-like beta-propeller repeat protein [Dongiaceae bacterium]
MKKFATLLSLLALAGCSWLGIGKDKQPLPGTRVSVLQLDKQLEVSPDIQEIPVRLPAPHKNEEWTQAGGNAQHNLHHVTMSAHPTIAWVKSIGSGNSSERRILSEPILVENKLIALDSEGQVTALDAGSGQVLWQVTPKQYAEDTDKFGGGLAYGEGKIFVTSPYARLIALDAKNGKEVWNVAAPAPYRAPPSYSDGRVFAMTIDNQLTTNAAENGRQLWVNNGVGESAGLLGGGAPAVSGSTVVAPYSSGELIALDVVGGRTIWGDSLAGTTRGSQVGSFGDIHGSPVIDSDLVVTIGNGGVAAASDLTRGARKWDVSLGGTHTPWVAGDFVFLLTNNAELVCLTREEGKIRWVQILPRYDDPEDTSTLTIWSGPVLAGDRLFITGSNGLLLALSPYDGKVLGKIALPEETHLSPIAANDTLYVLLDNGDVIALR